MANRVSAAKAAANVPFRKRQRGTDDRKIVGTIQSLMPKGTGIKISERNFRNASVRIKLTLVAKDGAEYEILCSSAVSSMLRNEEISIGNLVTLPVVEGEVKDEKSGKMVTAHFVGLPEGYSGRSTTIDLDKVNGAELQSPSDDDDEEFLPEGFLVDYDA